MKPTQFDRRILGKISASVMYRALSRIFESQFALPLFLEPGGSAYAPGCRSPFCIAVNPPHASRTRCPLSKFPPLETLEPWPWTMACAANLQVTLVPVRTPLRLIGWLTTGHAMLVGGDGNFQPFAGDLAPALRNTRAGGELERKYREVGRMTPEKHQAVISMMDSIGEMLGANINLMMIGIGGRDVTAVAEIKRVLRNHTQPPTAFSNPEIESFTRETGMTPEQYGIRCRLESARRRILAGNGRCADILEAARQAGWCDAGEFREVFHRHFDEFPAEHFRRMKTIRREIAHRIAA